MNTTHYKIADIIICIQSDLNFPFDLDKYKEYRCLPGKSDYLVKVQRTTDIAKLQNQMKRLVNTTLWSHQYIDADDKTWSFFVYDQFYYAALCADDKTAVLYHLGEESILQLINTYRCNPLSFIGMEKILISNTTIILHSCHVQYHGKSILFSAPSGTGKSTQGSLWEQVLGAKVINGDRTAISKKDDSWIAYGIPMCGTSQIHVNKCAELDAIIILEQHRENIIRKLDPFTAFQKLYKEVTSYYWDKNFVEDVMNILEKLIENIPVYLYQCTKETDAALFLEKYLKKEGLLYEKQSDKTNI